MNTTESSAEPDWQWLNPPAKWDRDPNGLTLLTEPETDFWRLTHDGGIRDNGHFYYQEIEGSFRAKTLVQADYRDQYDQAGLMMRLDPIHWIKCGIEFVDGIRYVSAVVTRETSDWATAPAPANNRIRFSITRHNDLVEIHYRTEDNDWQQLRQLSFPNTKTTQIGFMAASPKGNGFQVKFSEWDRS